MVLLRRRFLCLAGAVAVLPALARAAMAQAYPTRPLRWIVGYPAGGATDTVMRIVGNLLSERLGQPVVIENRPGAATNLATQAVATAPPDGYTLLFAATTNAINATLYETLPFNFLRDIAPVSGLVEMPLVLVVNPSLSAATVAEFIDHAKANPGTINVASFGTGTISHLAIELLKAMTGVNVVHVPYRGGASMVADLLGGRVQAGVDALPNALPHVQRGALRALAVMSAKRAETLPEVPTVGETVAGYDVNTWTGVGAPAGTPPEIVDKLNREINAALATASLKTRLADIGATPIFYTPAEFGGLVAAETRKWAKVIKSAGVKAE
ncbi:MAG: Bug family tripartite tricarboxylate transporter substrate binding protein [Xanthobacteraceae bacterium]